MKWFARILAHAFARRVAFVIVAGLLAWAGIGRAEAVEGSCNGNWTSSAFAISCTTREAAYAYAHNSANHQRLCPTNNTAQGATYTEGPSGSLYFYTARVGCKHNTTGSTQYLNGQTSGPSACPSGRSWNTYTNTCEPPCDQRSTTYHSGMKVATAMQCDSGCVYIYTIDPANPAGRIGTPQSGTCQPDTWTCPSGWVQGSGVHTSSQSQICTLDPNNDPGPDEKPDECPAGSSVDSSGACKPDSNTCPAGKTKGPDGSCIDSSCPAGQVKGPDGSCKKDGNGDGQPDADDGTFSGGDDCNTPPQCSGDAIACGQARIQWRIECNTRKNRNISGGACNAMPVCAGEKCDALEYSSLLMQWRSACALEGLAKGSVAGPGAGPGGGVFVGGGGSGAGDANGNGVPDGLESPVEGATGPSPSVGNDPGLGWDSVNTGGWLGGGSCPGLPPITINGVARDVSGPLCEQTSVLANLLYASALAAAAYIIGRAASGG